MKKLIYAVLVACMSSVIYGAGCEIDGGAECVYAYRVKLVGKTVKGKIATAKGACESDACWAKPASFRVAGYIYNDGKDYSDVDCECNCPCEGHLDFADNKCVFWDQDKKQFFCDVESVEVDVYDVLRNAGGKNKCQIGLKVGNIYLAGLGVYNPETKRLKRASGCFAGTCDQPTCSASACEVDSTPAMVFKPCDTTTETECEKAVAFGRWNMAYKSEKVSMLKQGVEPLSAGCLLPKTFIANTEG